MMKMNNKKIYLLSFFIPIGIFFIISLISGYVPFFDEVYQIFDARHQYPGFLTEFVTRLNGENFFYSFNGGLGFNFIGTLTYYLMSPLNLLLIFFNAETLTYFFIIVIYLHFGLAGLSMSIYLNNQKDKDHIWIIVFSVAFAFMGYISCYYYNYMWISSVVMLPLIMLGIDKIINNEKSIFYIVSLTLGIIFNYYIGYILCIFSVVYFIYKILCAKNVNYKQIIIKFITASLCCGLLSAFILIPTFFALIIGKAKIYGSSWINYFEFNANSTNIFYKLTPASFQIGDQSYGPAMVYSTLFAVVSTIMLFFNKSISIKEKIVTAAVLVFYYLSFSFNLLDFGWQLFQRPIWWQSRYSFTFSTFMILFAYRNTLKMDKISINDKKKFFIIAISIVLLIASTFSSFSLLEGKKFNFSTYFFLAFSIILFVQYILFYGNKKLKWYFIGLISLELTLNLYNNLSKNDFNNSAYEIYNKVIEYKNPVDYIKKNDTSFYRMEFMQLNTTNDGMLLNYNGINFFNSTRNQQVIDFLEYKLGVDVDSGCGVKLKAYNPALLSLLNIKYLIGETDYYNILLENGYKSIYQNKYPLSLGFMVNKRTIDTELYNTDMKINIDRIYNAFLDNNSSFFEYIDPRQYINYFDNTFETKLVLGSSYEVKDKNLPGFVAMNYTSNGNYLLFQKDIFNDATSIQINNKTYNKKIGEFIHLKKGDKLKVTYLIRDDKTLYNTDFKFDLFNIDEYEKASKELSTNLWDVSKDNGHLVSGKITSTTDRNILFTSIGYEKGFKITVDNKEVKPTILFDTFIGVELEPGEHFVTIDYEPYGLKTGLIISSGTLIIIISYYTIKRKKAGRI